MKDLRIYNNPPTSHSDFDCWIYQCQPQSYKFLDYDWDFAVRRQGFKSLDYNKKVYDLKELDRRHHWMLIKPKTAEAYNLLLKIDYNELARADGTSRCGFGKADLVREYERFKEV